MAARGTKVVIMGEQELLSKLKALGDEAIGLLDDAVTAGAEIVAEEARSRARVRTGKLRDSIGTGDIRRFGYRTVVPVGPGKEAFYGIFVEKGTSKQAAHPFLRPALRTKKEQVKATVGGIVRKGLEKVARS